MNFVFWLNCLNLICGIWFFEPCCLGLIVGFGFAFGIRFCGRIEGAFVMVFAVADWLVYLYFDDCL